MDRYVILRRSDEGLSGGVRSASSQQTQPSLPTLNVAELSQAEAADIDRDRKTYAIAPSMPLQLIAPFGSTAAVTSSNWAFEATGVASSRFNGTNVRVAVLDTGIDQNHLAFQGVTFANKDFTGEGSGDENGHGTHCAATIFGRPVNGQRIGVAPGVTQAYIAKVLNREGNGNSEWLFDAMIWAEQCKVDVISMSLGFDFGAVVDRCLADNWPQKKAVSHALVVFRRNLRLFDSLMESLIKREGDVRVPLVVAAAGNESERGKNIAIEKSLPSAAIGVLSVGAVDCGNPAHSLADFSNANPDLCAPGVDIVSAKAGTKNGLVAMSGTSMACPHAAGVAALWIERQVAGNRGVSGMRIRLVNGANINVCATSHSDEFGAGLIVAP